MIAAGELTRRFVLRRPTENTGNPQVLYQAVATLWGKKVALSGRESTALQIEADYRVTIRYRTDIKATDHLLDGTQQLELIGPPLDPTGRQEDLELLVRAKAA